MIYPPYTMYNGYPPNTNTPHPFYTNQPSSGVPPPYNPYHNVPMNIPPYTHSYAEPAGPTTPFVRWIEDYPLPDGLKMPSHIGTYNGKGDPDNFLHLFEGAIRMQKWVMPVACHMFTYTLRDAARIWWNGQKPGSIINLDDLKAKFRSHFSQQKKFTRTHLTVHNIKQKENESTRNFVTRYTDETLQILGLHEEQRISGFVHGLRNRNLVEFLSTDLPETYKDLMEKNIHVDRSQRGIYQWGSDGEL